MKEVGAKGNVSSVAILGRTRGEVRRLPAFDKKRHSVPDRVCQATQAFLEKLCEEQLAEEAEALFQASREQFGYKRREISLSVGSGFARLETKDFALELRYELAEDDPADYIVETCVRDVASRELMESASFSVAIGRRFDRLRCGLAGRVSVESVIDAVEDDESGETSVAYPSDCSHCTVAIDGLAGEVFVDGGALEVRCGQLTTAAGLVETFERIGLRVFAKAGLSDFLGPKKDI